LLKGGNQKLETSFASLTGSISQGLHCNVHGSFSFDPAASAAEDEAKEESSLFSKAKTQQFCKEIEEFLKRGGGMDSLVDFGSFGDSLTGNFGIGGIIESICAALNYFPENEEESRQHLVLLPTSFGTEQVPLFRTCPNDLYASSSLASLLAIFRARNISLSLVAPGLGDSTIVEQFIVFKCNEKISSSRLLEGLGADWVVRLSANLVNCNNSYEDTATRKSVCLQEDNELLNQTLIRLSKMAPEERGVALKTLLDPATSSFSNQFRQKFAVAVKSRLQSQDPPALSNNARLSAASIIHNSSSNQRRASQDSLTCFWAGCIKFVEKQQNFLFRVQFVAVEGQAQLPRVSLENWPHELCLTGLLDSRKDSIQAGLSVGYAFRVNIATADTPTASYLMSKMTQQQQQQQLQVQGKLLYSNHLACFRISQDVLIMLRVLNQDDLQFIGYLIDRRFPKNNLTPAAQAASNAINSLTAMKAPLSTTLSTGIDGLSLQQNGNGRRPSFDVKMMGGGGVSSSFPTKIQNNSSRPPQQQQQQQHNHQNKQAAPPMNYMSSPYPPQYLQQQQQQQQKLNNNTPQQQAQPQYPIHLMQHPQQTQSPGKIAAISSNHLTTAHQLLTDPQAILQKLRGNNNSNNAFKQSETAPSPALQANEGNPSMELDQSFLDAWLN